MRCSYCKSVIEEKSDICVFCERDNDIWYEAKQSLSKEEYNQVKSLYKKDSQYFLDYFDNWNSSDMSSNFTKDSDVDFHILVKTKRKVHSFGRNKEATQLLGWISYTTEKRFITRRSGILTFDYENPLFIITLYVDPDYRNNTFIAENLVSLLTDTASAVWAEAYVHEIVLRDALEANGFNKISTWRSERRIDVVVWNKDLPNNIINNDPFSVVIRNRPLYFNEKYLLEHIRFDSSESMYHYRDLWIDQDEITITYDGESYARECATYLDKYCNDESVMNINIVKGYNNHK